MNVLDRCNDRWRALSLTRAISAVGELLVSYCETSKNQLATGAENYRLTRRYRLKRSIILPGVAVKRYDRDSYVSQGLMVVYEVYVITVA